MAPAIVLIVSGLLMAAFAGPLAAVAAWTKFGQGIERETYRFAYRFGGLTGAAVGVVMLARQLWG